MENKIIKKLIILGAIVFSLALANNAYAANYALSNNSAVYHYNPYSSSVDNQGYSQYSYYQESGYNTNLNPTNPNPINPINPAVNPVNQYYANQVNQGYPQPQPQPQYAYYQQSGYSTNNVIPSTVTTKPNVVNNYYYQTAPATTAKTSTTSTDKSTTDTSNTEVNNANGLGASAYNGITALSLRGSGSFMPSSVWQWILVIVLILAIIIISRILIKKPTLEMQESHVAHAH